MLLELPREKLTQLLYLTNTIVERRNTMPILANVKLMAQDDVLHVAATDLEVSLVGETEAEVKTPGGITVNAKFLYDIVKELAGETVTLKTVKGERLEVDCGQSHFKINGISTDEFPSLMGVTLSNSVAVEASRLREMLEKTSYAVSMDETRYNINGVYAETIEEEGTGNVLLRFVATDGHRLSMIDRSADDLEIESGVIIPRKGIQELKKVLDNNDGVAKVEVADGFFTVQSGDVTLGVRLIDGEFPDYTQVIPSETRTTATVDRSELLATVKRVSLVTTDKSRSVRFKLDNGTLMVSSSSPEYGEAVETISVNQEGEDVQIGFSARYVQDLLSAMSASEQVSIHFVGELGPGSFVGDSDEQYRCIVMPMRFE